MAEILKALVWCVVMLATIVIMEMHDGNSNTTSYTTQSQAATGIILSR